MTQSSELHEFFYASYRILLSREIDAKNQEKAKNWSVAPPQLGAFLSNLLLSKEFNSKPLPLERITAFCEWLSLWSPNLSPEAYAATLTAAYRPLVDSAHGLAEEAYALPADPKLPPLALAIRIAPQDEDFLILNLDPQRKLLTIADGEEILASPPLGAARLSLDDLAPDACLEFALETKEGLVEIKAQLRPTAEAAAKTLSLASWIARQEIQALLQSPFGAAYQGLHTHKFITPEGVNLLWREHDASLERIPPTNEAFDVDYGRNLIDFYAKKNALPAGVSLPVSPKLKSWLASPATTFGPQHQRPIMIGMLDCGFDQERLARYLVEDRFRRGEHENILRANAKLGDAFISDWLSAVLELCREARASLFDFDVNLYHEAEALKSSASAASLLQMVATRVVEAVASGQGILLIPDQWFRALLDQEAVQHDFLELLQALPRKKRGGRDLRDAILAIAANPDLRDADAVSAHCRRTAAEIAQQAAADRIALLGFFDATGLGGNSSMFARALDEIAAPLAQGPPDKGRARSYRLRPEQRRDGSSATIICANPNDAIRLYLRDVELAAPQDRRIGFFLWETSKAPESFVNGCRLVEEIWVPTQFLKPIFEEIAPNKPVVVVGKAIDSRPPAALRLRERLKIAPSARVFVAIGEFGSSIERKNFLAAVRAFKRAVKTADEAVMILKLKAIDIGHWSNKKRHWETVMEEIAHDPRFRVVVARYSEAEYWGLLDEADAFVSLHRGEGFGYGLAHAMLIGKPVVTVAWSGEADFCTQDTAFVAEHKLIPVEPWMMNSSSYLGLWADARMDSAAEQIRLTLDQPELVRRKTAAGRAMIQKLYAPEVFQENLRRALVGG